MLIHSEQHLRPILRFRSARAGVDGDDGVTAVVFAGKEYFYLLLFVFGPNGIKIAQDFVHKAFVVLLNGDIYKRFDIVKALFQRDVMLERAFFVL